MGKVFSRWPSQVRLSGAPNPGTSDAFLPRWMLAARENPWRRRLLYLSKAFTIVTVPAGLAFVAGKLFARTEGIGDFAAILALAAALLVAVSWIVRLQGELSQSKACYRAIFERAGISVWLEDWSAAADRIAALRRSGIVDMEAHFATRPEELRALCANVMITDVNQFTVDEAGAASKADFVGPLDRLLPHTDQTFVQWLVAFARGDRFFRSEAHITLPDGTELDTLFTAALPADLAGFAEIIVTSLDITGYKSEQLKLLAADGEIARASRISTVGALSASIAHEVNSPLAAIVANAQAALRWLKRPAPELDDALEAIAAIVASATRAKEVVTRTRAFVGHANNPPGPFDIVGAAREANLLVERELRTCGAAVHINAADELPLVRGDIIQIQQVITNLLLNAAQAMAGQLQSKEITVSFKHDGDSVRVDVADSGPGIDPLQLERVFDPFYTTKSDGMGLGLAICRNSIDAQGGNIWASSDQGRGATIHFTLPTHNG